METSEKREACVAILFADVVDSSRLYTTYGDVEARRLVGGCLAALSQVVGEQHGQVIKTIGDEIMCTFPTAERAVSAACEMHEMLEDEITVQTNQGRMSLAVRIGLHHGPTILDD